MYLNAIFTYLPSKFIVCWYVQAMVVLNFPRRYVVLADLYDITHTLQHDAQLDDSRLCYFTLSH